MFLLPAWDRDDKICTIYCKRGGAAFTPFCDSGGVMILPTELHATTETSLDLDLIRKYSIP
ncbi:MAG: hypothetical protein CFE26_23970, partial [Verrucomicrobiales bacterium VVV1]